jgi:hypothetical protein
MSKSVRSLDTKAMNEAIDLEEGEGGKWSSATGITFALSMRWSGMIPFLRMTFVNNILF